MAAYSLKIERLQPTSLLPDGNDDAAAFESIWSRLAMISGDWRAHRFLDDDGGLFLKGMAVPLLCDTQMWTRRWDVHREARKLARLERHALKVPGVIAWGAESRWGIPIRSFLLLQRVPDATDFETAAKAFASTADSAEEQQTYRAVGKLVAQMHVLGLRHGDLAPRNILLTQDEQGPVAMLIDIPRLRWPRTRWRQDVLRRQDLYRLTKSTLRLGGGPKALRALLEEAAGPEADSVLERTRSITAIRNRPRRKAKLYFWRWTGI